MNDNNGLGMIKIQLTVVTVVIYTKQLCIYNMNNDDGIEMIEIQLMVVIYIHNMNDDDVISDEVASKLTSLC